MSRGGGWARAWLALPLLLLCASTPAAATPAALFGPGPRTQALAGSGASLNVGSEAAFQNPAQLSLVRRPELSAGYGLHKSWLYWQRGTETEKRVELAAEGATQLGFALPLWLGDEPLVLGLSSVSPGGTVARADLPLAEQPQFPLLVTRRQAVDFDLSAGYRPLPFLALGVGLRALAALSGNVEVERAGSRTSTSVRDSLEPELAPLFGASAFIGRATASLVLRTALRADFNVELAAVDLGATQLPPLHLAGVAHYDPLALHAEYAHRLGELTALAGVVYQRFSDTPALLPRTVSCPSERPDCAALDVSAPDLHDTFDLHLALTYRLVAATNASLELRAGYAYLPSPVPEQTGSANFLDAARHRLAVGYGIALERDLPWSFDVAASLDQLESRSHRKATDVSDDNAGYPELSTRGHLVNASFSLTVKL